MKDTESWHSLVESEMDERGESWGDVVGCTLTTEEMAEEFDRGFGGANGKPFTLWTRGRVYFPVVYDGAEWAGSAPRNPCGESTEHQGGR